MIDQSKISSGYDVEIMMGEEYIRHMLLCSFETGTTPWFTESDIKDERGRVIRKDMTILHPPAELQDKRLYPVHPEFEGHEHPFPELAVVYSTQGNEFKVTILKDHPLGAKISVTVFPTYITNSDNDEKRKVEISNLAGMNLDLDFSLVHETTDNGLLRNIRMKTELLDINGPLIELAAIFKDENGNPVFDKELTLAKLKRQIDRERPFHMAGGGKLQDIQMKVFADSDETTDRAIGVFVNLVLQDGPDKNDILQRTNNTDNAQNFLPKNSNMAFGMPAFTFPKLAKDLFEKMAVLKEESDSEYYYPFKHQGEDKGTLFDISIYPEKRNNGFGAEPTNTDVLIIDIFGEYSIDWEIFGVDVIEDPNFNLRIRLIPTNKDGLMVFELDYEVDLSTTAELVLLFGEIALAFFMPHLAAALLVITPVGIAIGEYALADYVGESAQKEIDRSGFLDALPNKLVVEKKSWDPLYNTLHQLEISADHIAVNDSGFAFSAGDVFIGKRFEPVTSTVIRNVTRDAEGKIDGLIYRNADYFRFENNDFVNIYPATDRMAYGEVLRPLPDQTETYRIHLSMDQVNERLSAFNKHLKDIPYQPKKIKVTDNQIDKILAISDIEFEEIKGFTRDSLRTEITNRDGDTFRTTAEVVLELELARTPTEEEINTRVNEYTEMAIDNAFDERFSVELDKRMKLELEPSEFAALQNKELLTLGKGLLEIIEMHRDGKTTVYYRDIRFKPKPEPEISDNLLDLPRYNE